MAIPYNLSEAAIIEELEAEVARLRAELEHARGVLDLYAREFWPANARDAVARIDAALAPVRDTQ